MKQIVLQNPVRCFKPAFSKTCPILANISKTLPQGTRIYVHAEVTKTYDHQDRLAVPYEYMGEEGFLLHEEVEASLATAVPVAVN
jgi:hypothetical protein